MSEGDRAESSDTSTETEATGETVGEAKWAALRELERRFPGLDKTAVEFVVLSEGERGLLGVGFLPARVVARAPAVLRQDPPDPPAASRTARPSSAAVERITDLVGLTRDALALEAAVSVHDEGDTIVATFEGEDLGLVIGKHGQTIDALQFLANAIVARSGEERIDVVIDASGYRSRRRATLEALADRTADRVVANGNPIALDPMTASERKIVHLHLQERPDVATSSEGQEPARHVIVSPSE